MFRGNAPTRIDAKGRFKLPSIFRAPLEAKYGRELFLTSVSGECVRVYPMPVWLEIEEKLAKVPSTHPSRQRFLDRVNYYGQLTELDGQGRVIIPLRLREAAGMNGPVDVLGVVTYLEVWNHDGLDLKMKREPFTDDDARSLSEFGI